MRHRPVQDVSGLPDYGFGSRMTTLWGTLGFMALEGIGFALASGAISISSGSTRSGRSQTSRRTFFGRPFSRPFCSSAFGLTRSPNETPSVRICRKSRRDLLIMSLVAIAVLAILRAFEFSTLHVRWDQNAYGSIVWVLLGLHTAHVLTDAIDTFVLTALMFTRHVHGKRFSDVEDNAIYWDFVVLSWLPIYVLIYWVPRF